MFKKASLRSLGPALALALVGCGGGRTGTLSLKITDAPLDGENVASVFVTLSKVEVHLAGDDHEEGNAEAKDDAGWHTIDMPPRAIDLFRLQNGATETLAEPSLPEGKVTQMRVHLDPAGRNEVVLKEGARKCPLDMSAVDKKGVRIIHPFKIAGGVTTDVLVDFVLQESVEKLGDCQYRLHPKILIKSTQVRGQGTQASSDTPAAGSNGAGKAAKK